MAGRPRARSAETAGAEQENDHRQSGGYSQLGANLVQNLASCPISASLK